MDHQEKHHQKKEHEREAKKKAEAAYEREEAKSSLPFHPAWLVVIGIALTALATTIWTVLW